MTQLFCYVTKIVRIIRKKSRGPTYLVDRIVRVTTYRDFIYVVRLISKFFNYSKKGAKIFVRVKPNPTYRVSDLSSLPMYKHYKQIS